MAPRSAEIDLPRVVDRDDLFFALHSRGHDVESVDGDGRYVLKVRMTEAELLEVLEEWLADSRAPLVPERVSKREFLLRPVAG